MYLSISRSAIETHGLAVNLDHRRMRPRRPTLKKSNPTLDSVDSFKGSNESVFFFLNKILF